MHTVIVDGDVSYPATSGKRLRTLHLMLRVARRHRLTYIGRCNASRPEARQAREFLGDHGIETILVDHPVPNKAGLAFYGRLAGNLFSGLPYSVASHQSLPMRRTLGEYAARHRPDVWQFEWLPYLEMLEAPAAARVVMAHNVDTLIWRRWWETCSRGPKRVFLKSQWRKMERYERTHFPRANRVVAVSAEDARILHQDFDVPHVAVVDNGIDRAFFECVDGSARDASSILFLGALDWRPNLDAVGLLLDDIFPRVLAQEPSARLRIVGRHPPAKLKARVPGLAGVELHPDVPDVRPFLGSAGVMTVPLRIGGGSRLKILEALASGLPVVSTAVGAEGLCLEAGQHFVQADDPAAMAQELVSAIRTPAPIRAMAAGARDLVLERYDWDALAMKLEAVWDDCKTSGAKACASSI